MTEPQRLAKAISEIERKTRLRVRMTPTHLVLIDVAGCPVASVAVSGDAWDDIEDLKWAWLAKTGRWIA